MRRHERFIVAAGVLGLVFNEAVCLADRVIVLSARPGRVLDDVAVDLPVIRAGYTVPLVMLYPVMMVGFGLGPESKIAFAALYAFIPTMLTAPAGVAALSPALAEMLGAGAGLGFLITRQRTLLDSPGVYAGIVLVLAMTGLQELLLRRLERRVEAFRGSHRAPGPVTQPGGDQRAGRGRPPDGASVVRPLSEMPCRACATWRRPVDLVRQLVREDLPQAAPSE